MDKRILEQLDKRLGKDKKILEHYIGIWKSNPENLTKSGIHRLINMLIKEREDK